MSDIKKPSEKPNNYLKEGEHNTVTKEGLKQIEAQRAWPNVSMDYTIGGTIETVVHSNVEAERNYVLTRGHQRMNMASQKLQHDYVFAANKGRSKAQFQATNDTGKTYAQIQRENAAKAKTKKKTRAR